MLLISATDEWRSAHPGATIGLLELTGRARAMQEFSFRVFEAFAAATLIYLLTNLVVVLAMRSVGETRTDHVDGQEPNR